MPGACAIAPMAFSRYLIHKPAYHWVEQTFDQRLADTAALSLCLRLGAGLAAGALLYLLAERPGLRLRYRFIRGADSA